MDNGGGECRRHDAGPAVRERIILTRRRQDRLHANATPPSGHRAEGAVADPAARPPHRLTRLNDGLFSQRALAESEEIWYSSSHDGRKIQGWILKPPGFDPKKKYPLILEIHGGPFANYGDRF